ncbi:MAG: family 10 glycosylhydrolase [Verrucomicrobia bacterium]|nr:family 10 glycosylhydrolase [Verrucomicrobiota bacterium]
MIAHVMRNWRYSVAFALMVSVAFFLMWSVSSKTLAETKASPARKEAQTKPDRARIEKASGKREFRGAWIHTVFQDEYAKMSPAEMRKDFVRKLDFLKKCGINAVIFQVRPEADAWYPSRLEPWSRFFTGKQGVAPQPLWDPMEFLIEECHKRNMEFHAWLNPYRASASGGSAIFAKNHLYQREPGRFVQYGKLIVFDPGIPANRQFICSVIKDIVSRYDVDAIHMDDYFYPYPEKGVEFDDRESFRRYGQAAGWGADQKEDWRRDNVNRLIQEIKHTILDVKPWVRLGVSPFGIYRNKSSTPDGSGSDTGGLQNYKDLYADVLKWVQFGWIDYNIPQIYWEIGHKTADYATLAEWWNRNANGRHLYIGQNVVRTMKMKELREKIDMSRKYSNIGGNCFWPADELLKNTGGIATQLQSNYHRYPALIPAYTRMNPGEPAEVKNLTLKKVEGAYLLKWKSDANIRNPSSANYYVIYRVSDGSPKDLTRPENIIGTTRQTSIRIPFRDGKRQYLYGVTAVNRFHNESPKGVWKRVKP